MILRKIFVAIGLLWIAVPCVSSAFEINSLPNGEYFRNAQMVADFRVPSSTSYMMNASMFNYIYGASGVLGTLWIYEDNYWDGNSSFEWAYACRQVKVDDGVHSAVFSDIVCPTANTPRQGWVRYHFSTTTPYVLNPLVSYVIEVPMASYTHYRQGWRSGSSTPTGIGEDRVTDHMAYMVSETQDWSILGDYTKLAPQSDECGIDASAPSFQGCINDLWWCAKTLIIPTKPQLACLVSLATTTVGSHFPFNILFALTDSVLKISGIASSTLPNVVLTIPQGLPGGGRSIDLSPWQPMHDFWYYKHQGTFDHQGVGTTTLWGTIENGYDLILYFFGFLALLFLLVNATSSLAAPSKAIRS